MSKGPEGGVVGDPFVDQLGRVMSEFAEIHPTPDDETAMSFITDGGIVTTSPRQFAAEIVNRTPQGLHTVEFYRKISNNLGDPSGQRIIDDLRSMVETEKGRLSGPI